MELEELYRTYIHEDMKDELNEQLITELKTLVSTIELFFNQYIDNNPAKYKVITEDSNKFYMIKGGVKHYFKRIIVDDEDNENELRNYFAYINASYEEDKDDNMTLYSDNQYSPIIRFIIKELKLENEINVIHDLINKLEKPVANEINSSDKTTKLICKLFEMFENMNEQLSQSLDELSDKINTIDRRLYLLEHHGIKLIDKETTNDSTSLVSSNSNERTTTTNGSSSSEISSNEESEENILSLTPDERLIDTIDELIKQLIGHIGSSNEVILYSRALTVCFGCDVLKDIIKNRLLDLNFKYKTRMSGNTYSPNEMGKGYEGYVASVNEVNFDRSLTQRPTQNIQNICCALERFYTQLLESYTQLFNIDVRSIPDKEKYIESLSPEVRVLRELSRRKIKRFKDDEQLYNSVKPIQYKYISEKLKLLKNMISRLNHELKY